MTAIVAASSPKSQICTQCIAIILLLNRERKYVLSTLKYCWRAETTNIFTGRGKFQDDKKSCYLIDDKRLNNGRGLKHVGIVSGGAGPDQM